jgi:hypothetical protein
MHEANEVFSGKCMTCNKANMLVLMRTDQHIFQPVAGRELGEGKKTVEGVAFNV